jgi:hypothetical protein
MRQHAAYFALMSGSAMAAAVLITVLLDPTVVGVTLTPIHRMLMMSSALSLTAGSACVIFWWSQYAVAGQQPSDV